MSGNQKDWANLKKQSDWVKINNYPKWVEAEKKKKNNSNRAEINNSNWVSDNELIEKKSKRKVRKLEKI